ncbi:MAG: cyclase family protein [Proteobacteria bacterium]|nr:cyclase family protein [Pseudomonadota bacterium]
MSIVDLSVTLDNDKNWAPWWARTHVKRQNHKFGRLAVWLLFGLKPRYLRTGLGWANDEIKLTTHGTTHLDAPWHYAPTSEGKTAKTIDQVPLEWCYGDGVVLDMRHKGDGEAISIEDVKTALADINYTIKPMDIVLIQTGNDRMLGTRDYFAHGAGVSAAATRWILEQGVKVTGIDSWGWDVPLPILVRQAKETGRGDLFWEGHFVGVDKEYCHLERLTNLDKLPPFGFKVSCFPLKVRGGSAGPARVVAILEE